MLRLFHSRHPLFPVRWANAVTGWLLGLRSNSGSLTINNTATPGNGDGPSIDVNLAWAKSLIASETPRPETERATEDLVPPEDWQNEYGTGDGEKQETTALDGSTKVQAYPCCGKSLLPAAADHRHKSNVAPLGSACVGGFSANGEVGESAYAARFDHRHPFPSADQVLADTEDEEGEGGSSVQDILTSHNTRIKELENAESKDGCACAANWEEQALIDDAQDEDIVTVAEAAEEAKTAADAAKTKIDAVTVAVGNETRVPLNRLTGNIDGHSGTCYVTIDNAGNLGHSFNSEYNLLHQANQVSGATKLLTDADLSSDDIETLTDFADAVADGVTQKVTLCTGISYEYVATAGGKCLVFTTQELTFTKGLLTEVGTAKKTYNEYDGG